MPDDVLVVGVGRDGDRRDRDAHTDEPEVQDPTVQGVRQAVSVVDDAEGVQRILQQSVDEGPAVALDDLVGILVVGGQGERPVAGRAQQAVQRLGEPVTEDTDVRVVGLKPSPPPHGSGPRRRVGAANCSQGVVVDQGRGQRGQGWSFRGWDSSIKSEVSTHSMRWHLRSHPLVKVPRNGLNIYLKDKKAFAQRSIHIIA